MMYSVWLALVVVLSQVQCVPSNLNKVGVRNLTARWCCNRLGERWLIHILQQVFIGSRVSDCLEHTPSLAFTCLLTALVMACCKLNALVEGVSSRGYGSIVLKGIVEVSKIGIGI